MNLWSRGDLTWREIVVQLWLRGEDHKLIDRAALLSFYLLLAFFPLLLTLSSFIGYVLSSQSDTYWALLNYIFQFMPRSAHDILTETVNQIRAGASGGKLSFGLLTSFWAASSGVTALVEAMNIAFGVSGSRRWWRRRFLAMCLTFGISILLAASLTFLLATSSLGNLVAAHLAILNHFRQLSKITSWFACFILLAGTLILIYRFGPNIHRKHWSGVLPGTLLALAGGVLASVVLRTYLQHFGTLGSSYGSLAGIIALLFWLYACSFAILLGGELNALILSRLPLKHRKH